MARLRLLVAVVLTLAMSAACTGSTTKHAAAARPTNITAASPHVRPTATVAPIEAKCTYALTSGDLPTWARAGFTSPSSQKFVTSASGDMVAVLFGYPMQEPRNEKTDGRNKILWVARDPTIGPMTVDAQLVGSTDHVNLGPVPIGPSYVDVPRAGCWRLTLHLPRGDDTVDIRYVKG
jgi:hypothetical protein